VQQQPVLRYTDKPITGAQVFTFDEVERSVYDQGVVDSLEALPYGASKKEQRDLTVDIGRAGPAQVAPSQQAAGAVGQDSSPGNSRLRQRRPPVRTPSQRPQSPLRGTPASGRRSYGASMPYPPRPQLRPRPEFAGSASPRPNPGVQARVEAFIVEQYAAGRSLRELAELTDRSFSAVRNILNRRGVHRRGAGAAARREPGS
jgi:hypothetical protein